MKERFANLVMMTEKTLLQSFTSVVETTLQNVLIFTIYDYISDYSKKGVIFDEIYSFGCGIYLSSDICRMRWAD